MHKEQDFHVWRKELFRLWVRNINFSSKRENNWQRSCNKALGWAEQRNFNGLNKETFPKKKCPRKSFPKRGDGKNHTNCEVQKQGTRCFRPTVRKKNTNLNKISGRGGGSTRTQWEIAWSKKYEWVLWAGVNQRKSNTRWKYFDFTSAKFAVTNPKISTPSWKSHYPLGSRARKLLKKYGTFLRGGEKAESFYAHKWNKTQLFI